MLSIIITALNENRGILSRTIKSILATSPINSVDIIVIDDCSDIPVSLDIKEKNIFLERNKFRMGVAQSRHIGATLANKKWLLFTDGHMVFKEGWYDNFVNYQKLAKENTVYCGTCLGLSEDTQDINHHKGKYCGAKLHLHVEKEQQILEGKWIQEKKNEDYYEISCLMGALYFIQKTYFFKLRGLSDLKMWGSDEPCLSLKTWLSGGEIRLLKNVQAGHIFRDASPYTTNIKFLTYNKIRMCKTLLPNELGRLLISRLPHNIDYFEAIQMINRENKFIEEYKNYYRSIFVIDFYEFCNKFDITAPNE